MPSPKTAAALLSATAVVALSACASPAGGARPDHLVVATQAPPAGLDFTTTGGAAAPQALMGNIYETLVRIDDSGTPQPFLAESWDISADGSEYIFHLREGVRFSNGKEFTAEDAAFSISYVQDNWTNALKAQMAPVVDAQPLDAQTLKVTLERASSSWLWSMGTLTGAMMTPASVERLATDPLGTGPYTLERFAVGESVSFTKREDYWGGEVSHDAQIRYFDDPTAALNALRVGDADVVWSMQAPQLLETLPEDISVLVGTTNGEVLLSMNNRAAPFDDPTVRKAVSYAIDRGAVNDVVYNGMATDTGGAPVPPTDPWFTGEDYYPFDPGMARELLDGRTPDVTITVPNLPYAQTASELIFSQLRDVGFRVRLETVEFPAVWLGQVLKGHDYQASLVAHVEPRDIPLLFGNPDYYLGYDSARARELIQAAEVGEQASNMEAAVDQIMTDAAALTLVNAPNIVLLGPGVSGVNPNVVTEGLPLRTIEVDK
ncbi:MULTISPECIES: ABC transporter substrate-binding protein [Corynebacterium]|uniref:ABC transporter substrate-binding protein n=1 Tax=Corynebacterium TaxID=1716 RepID=UPI00223B640B|nr:MULTISPECIES: ABC transporter substrate-binding protein [Corynebacterium]MCT1804801.1 ABC transporter substrate-binding protein [Corynebacterium sanguinis]MCT2157817.1 ABC transporter substrate-binding protein [Corynebacterium sanguinis]WNI12709.1 ABC transporter substrate-binding protein [Corynebacterium sp. Z-1]